MPNSSDDIPDEFLHHASDLRRRLDEIKGELSNAESCETIGDFRSNLLSALDATQGVAREIRAVIVMLRQYTNTGVVE